MSEATRALRVAATCATTAGVVLREIAKGAEPDPLFALEAVEKRLRLAFFAVRRELLVKRRGSRRAA